MSLDTKTLLDFCKRNILITVCVVFFTGMLLFLYIRLDEPARIETALAERGALLRKLKANVSNSAQLDIHLRDLSAINEGIASSALRVGDLAQNLKLFYELEATTGVKLIDVRPLSLPAAPKGAGPGSYVPIPFAVTIQGEYVQILNFIRKLERGRELCRILQASISAGEDGVQRITLNLEVLGVRT